MIHPTPALRCDHRTDLGLGCARSAGHAGSHWLTGQPDAARADLLRQGFFQESPAECADDPGSGD